MDKRKVILYSIIAVIVITAIIVISANWKLWFGKGKISAELTETITDSSGIPVPKPVDTEFVKSLMKQFRTEFTGVFPVDRDILKQISELNGQDLEYAYTYYKGAYESSLYKDVDSLWGADTSYDEIILQNLTQLGKNV